MAPIRARSHLLPAPTVRVPPAPPLRCATTIVKSHLEHHSPIAGRMDELTAVGDVVLNMHPIDVRLARWIRPWRASERASITWRSPWTSRSRRCRQGALTDRLGLPGGTDALRKPRGLHRRVNQPGSRPRPSHGRSQAPGMSPPRRTIDHCPQEGRQNDI